MPTGIHESNILNPGPGVGGHCISVDPWFLVESAPDLAILTRAAREVNDGQPQFVFNMIKKALLDDISGKRIAILGLTYKADVDDMRESPAVEIARLLQAAGAKIQAFEPSKPREDFAGIPLTASIESALDGADALVLLVGHTIFRQLQPQQIANQLPPAQRSMWRMPGMLIIGKKRVFRLRVSWCWLTLLDFSNKLSITNFRLDINFLFRNPALIQVLISTIIFIQVVINGKWDRS